MLQIDKIYYMMEETIKIIYKRHNKLQKIVDTSNEKGERDEHDRG